MFSFDPQTFLRLPVHPAAQPGLFLAGPQTRTIRASYQMIDSSQAMDDSGLYCHSGNTPFVDFFSISNKLSNILRPRLSSDLGFPIRNGRKVNQPEVLAAVSGAGGGFDPPFRAGSA